MNMVIKNIQIFILVMLPTAAYAYIGPGPGITAIGSALALVGAVLLGIVGFIWYPLRRLLRSRKAEARDFENLEDNIEEPDITEHSVASADSSVAGHVPRLRK